MFAYSLLHEHPHAVIYVLIRAYWPQSQCGYLYKWTPHNGIPLGYGLDDRGFETQQGLRIFLFTIASRPAMRSTRPPMQWVLGALSLGVKRPGREADHSPPSSAKVNAWSYTYYTYTPPVRLHGQFKIVEGQPLPLPLSAPTFRMRTVIVNQLVLLLNTAYFTFRFVAVLLLR
jgi:hypothetical protein